jgi:hypothetical protein
LTYSRGLFGAWFTACCLFEAPGARGRAGRLDGHADADVGLDPAERDAAEGTGEKPAGERRVTDCVGRWLDLDGTGGAAGGA